MSDTRQYAYLIERTDEDDPNLPPVEWNRRCLSRGTRTVIPTEPDSPATTRDLADELVRQNRVDHSYYTGPLRCSIWHRSPGDRLPDTAPEVTERFDY
ncbi:hypothetical protein [Streptomyces sp. H27-C3]|uniref:hypothetical protein n=1 Tax=Streptomyces sp. H27-C3 TaxID=3046305 RepID=UPI0024BAEB8A|nr:hypothetical protein [Streptomyces sp. H27-C3]MDJ0461570.1 hypothetical protein [Streptomyces sp. H27-C3]